MELERKIYGCPVSCVLILATSITRPTWDPSRGTMEVLVGKSSWRGERREGAWHSVPSQSSQCAWKMMQAGWSRCIRELLVALIARNQKCRSHFAFFSFLFFFSFPQGGDWPATCGPGHPDHSRGALREGGRSFQGQDSSGGGGGGVFIVFYSQIFPFYYYL